MSADASRRRIRVLTMVEGIGTYGGGERLARETTALLDRDRFEPTFCVTRRIRPDQLESGTRRLNEAGVPLLALDRTSRLDMQSWRRLISYMREQQVDILHSHMFGSNVWGALIRRRARVPVFVAHEHTWSFEGQPLRRFLDRNLIARRADAFVAVSRDDKRKMAEIERIPEAKLRFIPNGIPTPRSPDPNRDVRSELGIAPDQPVIGLVAVLRPQKALDVLVRATAKLRDEFPDVAVLIAGGEGGTTTAKERLLALARELGVADHVRLLGSRDDVPDLLTAFDVAVLSSDYEGSPLSVMEYMEAARPVVATRVGGVPDLIEDGVNGRLVEPQDPDGLAAAIAEVLRDPRQAKQMGRAGRELRRREFSIEATARRIESLYEELFARAGSRRAA